MSIDPQKSQVYNDYYLKKQGWFTDGHTRLQGVVIVAPDKNGDDLKVFEAYAHFCKAEEVHAMAYLLTGDTPRVVSYNGLIIGGTVKGGKLIKGPAPNFTSTAMVPVGISVDGRCVPFYIFFSESWGSHFDCTPPDDDQHIYWYRLIQGEPIVDVDAGAPPQGAAGKRPSIAGLVEPDGAPLCQTGSHRGCFSTTGQSVAGGKGPLHSTPRRHKVSQAASCGDRASRRLLTAIIPGRHPLC